MAICVYRRLLLSDWPHVKLDEREKGKKNCRTKHKMKNEGNQRRKRDYQFSISHAIPKKCLHDAFFMHMVHHIIIHLSFFPLTHCSTFIFSVFMYLILPLAEALMRLLTINSLFYSFFLCLFAKCRSRKKRETSTTTQNEDRQFLRKRRRKKSHEKEERNAKHQKMRRRLLARRLNATIGSLALSFCA